MSKLKKLHNRFLIFLVFAISCTRFAVGRILPFTHASERSTVKIFELSNEAWSDLGARVYVAKEDKQSTKSDGNSNSEPNKGSTDNSASKSADADKTAKGTDADKAANSSDKSKKDPAKPKPDDTGVGGGDGDISDGVGG